MYACIHTCGSRWEPPRKETQSNGTFHKSGPKSGGRSWKLFRFGPAWGHFGSILKPSWGHLEAILGACWANLGPFWPNFGHHGLSWALLGPSWGHLGAILRLSWGISGLRRDKEGEEQNRKEVSQGKSAKCARCRGESTIFEVLGRISKPS